MSNSFDLEQTGHSVQSDLGPKCLQRSTADDKLRVAFCISDTAPDIIEKIKSELQDGHSFSCWETNICGPGVQVCYTNKTGIGHTS